MDNWPWSLGSASSDDLVRRLCEHRCGLARLTTNRSSVERVCVCGDWESVLSSWMEGSVESVDSEPGEHHELWIGELSGSCC